VAGVVDLEPVDCVGSYTATRPGRSALIRDSTVAAVADCSIGPSSQDLMEKEVVLAVLVLVLVPVPVPVVLAVDLT